MPTYNRLSTEWLNANMSRAYPLDDLTGGVPGTLPCNALVDGFIMTTGFTDGDYDFYISKSENTGKSLILSIVAESVSGSKSVEFVNAIAIHEAEDYATVEFYAESEDESPKTLSGTFTIGSRDVVHAIPTANYTVEQTRIAPYVVRTVDNLCVTGIRVGDQVLTGEVTIEAGSGVDITADHKTGVISISASNYAPPDKNMQIIDDATLAEQLIKSYGQPVTKIAGVTPDEYGSIRINIPTSTTDPDEGDSDTPTAVDLSAAYHYVIPESGDVAGILTLKLAKDPRLADDFIKNLLNNINQLDLRIGKVDSSITAVDRVIGSVATQMTRLG